MPSEQRLHPAAILFDFGRHLRNFAVPALLLLFTSSRGCSGGRGGIPGVPGASGAWESWALVLLVPATLLSVARYLSYRIRYDEHELVISQGLLFRSQRHIPYARIHNLDATQNVAHRLFGVVEVRVETAGGAEPEAAIRVLPQSAYEDMRRRVLAGRGERASSPAAAAGREPGAGAGTVDGETLLHLGPQELLLHGLIEGRGLVVIGTIYGILWELGVLGWVWQRVPGAEDYGRGLAGAVAGALFGGKAFPFGLVAAALAGFAAFVLFVRLISMAFAVVRLYDYRVTRAGDDLRTSFGLLTRVRATIPVHRVQTLTVREGPLHRLFGRASVRVETAGGVAAGDGGSDRAWLAPIVARAALPRLAAQILPGFDFDALEWQPVDPRAFRRVVKRTVLVALAFTGLAAVPFGVRALVLLPPALALAVFVARRGVANLAWAVTGEAVVFRSGILARQTSVARMSKIQAVARRTSPFDRRAAMARVSVDTAGAREAHRVDIPYLGVETARRLHAHLAAQASRTAFRW